MCIIVVTKVNYEKSHSSNLTNTSYLCPEVTKSLYLAAEGILKSKNINPCTSLLIFVLEIDRSSPEKLSPRVFVTKFWHHFASICRQEKEFSVSFQS